MARSARPGSALRPTGACRGLCVVPRKRLVQRPSVRGPNRMAARDEKREDVQRQFVGGKLHTTFREKAEDLAGAG